MVDFESKPENIANFVANRKETIGHLIGLKVGGQELKPELTFKNPMAPAEEVPMCAMLLNVDWNMDPCGKTTVRGRVPYTNKGILSGAIYSKDKTAECEINFVCYNVEGPTKYYKYWHTNDVLIKGKLIKEECFVNNNKSRDYTQIENYEFVLVFEPSDKLVQEYHFDFGSDNKQVFPLGEKVASSAG